MANIKKVDNDYFADLEKSKEVWKNRQSSTFDAELTANQIDSVDFETDKKSQLMDLYNETNKMAEEGKYDEQYYKQVKEIMSLRDEVKLELEADAKMYQEEIDKLKQNSNDAMNQALIEANEKELQVINNLLAGNINSFKEINNDSFSVTSVANAGDKTFVAASKNGENTRLYVYDKNGSLKGVISLSNNNSVNNITYNEKDGSISVIGKDTKNITLDEINYTLELSGGKVSPLVTSSMKSVIETARNNAGSGYDNSCEAWVEAIYSQATGNERINQASAYSAYQAYRVSDSMDNIPPGAMVYGSGWPYYSDGSNPYGHVGVYLGNNQVADQGGVWDLQEWVNKQNAPCDGHVGWLGWGWSNNIDLSK